MNIMYDIIPVIASQAIHIKSLRDFFIGILGITRYSHF